MQNKSELSTHYQTDNNLLQYIDKLKQQNQYLKKALTTAEALIKNYQQQNNKIQMEIKILKCKLKQSDIKCGQMQKKFYSSSIHKFQEKPKLQHRHQQKQKQNLKYIQQLNNKLKDFVDTQQKYENKISQMEDKIKELQKKNVQFSKQKKYHVSFMQNQINSSVMVNTKNTKNIKNLCELKAFHLKLQNKCHQTEKNSQKQRSARKPQDKLLSRSKIKACTSMKLITKNQQESFHKRK